jgi:hypothetical protein
MRGLSILLSLIVSLIYIDSMHASHPYARALEDFSGDQLVIGVGNYPYFAHQRTIDPKVEYSIDIYRRVYPCLLADALNPATYLHMPDDRFAQIDFEHIGFAPYPIPSMLVGRNYKNLSSGAYEPYAWKESMDDNLSIPEQLFRILKPKGILLFKTCVLDDLYKFDRMNLGMNQTGPAAWKYVYEKAGFQDVSFYMLPHKTHHGWYVQMTAHKTQVLKKASGND